MPLMKNGGTADSGRSLGIFAKEENGKINKCIHGIPCSLEDCLHNPIHWVKGSPNLSEVIPQYCKKMLEYAADLRPYAVSCNLDIPYDQRNCKCKCLDIYGANILPANSPIFAFIHGGYWMLGSKEVAKSMVRSLVSSGVVVAVIGYNLVPDVTIDEMTMEVSRAIIYLDKFASERHSSGLYIGGHSAGAQLAFMALTVPNEIHLQSVRGLFLIAGIYDLVPLLQTSFNEELNMDEEVASRNSPIKLIDQLHSKYPKLKIEVVVGSHDSPIFIEHSKQFYDRLNEKAEKNSTNFNEFWHVSLKIIENEDHFSLIENLNDMNSESFQCLYNYISTNLL